MKQIVANTRPLIVKIIRLLNTAFEWVVLPVYATTKGLKLQRVGFRLVVASRVEDRFDSFEEAMNTLDTIVDIMTENNIPYFVYSRGYYKKSIVVMAEFRSVAIRKLRDSARLKNYYYIPEKERGNTGIDRVFSFSFFLHKSTKSILAVGFYRNLFLANKRYLSGRQFESKIEFWSKPENLSETMIKRTLSESGIMVKDALKGSIIAPVPNGIVRVVDKSEQAADTLRIGARDYPTIKMFTKDFLHEVNFPIDVVYTWVDGSDEKWLAKYETARREIDHDYKNNSTSRYTDHEELKYSLRSIQMYAPWVRNIYIVTDNQVPEWFHDNKGKVKFISHHDIFNDPSCLPVFNSHAIESQLHHIPGLSEHYLYLNDDIVLAKPTTPDMFFFSNGVAKVQPSIATIGSGPPSDSESAPSFAGKNAREIINRHTGRYIVSKYRHTAYPLLRSVAYEIEKKEREAYESTMRSKFRSTSDIPFTSILMQAYMTASGDSVPLNMPATIVDVSKPESGAILKKLLKSEHSYITVCLNESVTDEGDTLSVDRRVKGFLEEFLPIASDYEGRK